jgi:hypothetical protein
MVGMVIFAIAMLNLVRSKVEASGRAFRSAANQYSTVKRIYTAPLDLLHSTVRAQEQGK